ncbi:hypothetical protein [Actinomadura roseirufa]|uniref:hypothetical protein n=1 Tax=Actinomadura roseirufa TaxID=2094049 RepID=UPI0010419FAC|nr:hypothetical protein [Actinomadura roseirufa]
MHEPALSDAFQVELLADGEWAAWWGNQVVGRALRAKADLSPGADSWVAFGRDEVSLPRSGGEPFATVTAALICVRDAWRARRVWTSGLLGEDYWIEDRLHGVHSLWLGRIHLGHHLHTARLHQAFDTYGQALHPDCGFPDARAALLAVRAAWRRHLTRILNVRPDPPDWLHQHDRHDQHPERTET